MANPQQTILHASAIHHTGVVWSASFKKLGRKFLRDFSWDVYDTANPQQRYPLSAYMVIERDDGTFEMRFNDLSNPALGGSTKITVELRSPNSV